MSWNKPSENKSASFQQGRRKPTLLKGIIILSTVVIGVIGVVIFLAERDYYSPQQVNEKKHSLISEKSPAPAITNQQSNSEITPKNLVKSWDGKLVEFPPKNAYKDQDGIWRHPGGQMCFDPRPQPRKNKHQPRQIFDTNAEAQIAELLTMRPGTMVFGTMHYDRPGFQKEFLQALISPTKINEDDNADDVKLKEDVRDTIKDLAARMKNGEDVATILSDTRKELQRIGQYKRDLMHELRERAKERDLTPQDVKDCIEAANKMLESKGVAPMKVTDVFVRNLQRASKHQPNKEEL